MLTKGYYLEKKVDLIDLNRFASVSCFACLAIKRSPAGLGGRFLLAFYLFTATHLSLLFRNLLFLAN